MTKRKFFVFVFFSTRKRARKNVEYRQVVASFPVLFKKLLFSCFFVKRQDAFSALPIYLLPTARSRQEAEMFRSLQQRNYAASGTRAPVSRMMTVQSLKKT